MAISMWRAGLITLESQAECTKKGSLRHYNRRDERFELAADCEDYQYDD